MQNTASSKGDQTLILPDDAEHLRWYVLPSEIRSSVNGPAVTPNEIPIQPVSSAAATSVDENVNAATSSSAGPSAQDGKTIATEFAVGVTESEDEGSLLRSECIDDCPVPHDMTVSWPPSQRRIQQFANMPSPQTATQGEGSGQKTDSAPVVEAFESRHDVCTPVPSAKCSLAPKSKGLALPREPKFAKPPSKLYRLVAKVSLQGRHCLAVAHEGQGRSVSSNSNVCIELFT